MRRNKKTSPPCDKTMEDLFCEMLAKEVKRNAKY